MSGGASASRAARRRASGSIGLGSLAVAPKRRADFREPPPAPGIPPPAPGIPPPAPGIPPPAPGIPPPAPGIPPPAPGIPPPAQPPAQPPAPGIPRRSESGAAMRAPSGHRRSPEAGSPACRAEHLTDLGGQLRRTERLGQVFHSRFEGSLKGHDIGGVAGGVEHFQTGPLFYQAVR